MFSAFAYFQEPAVAVSGLTYGRFAAVRRTTGVNQRAMWSNDGITWNIATTPNSLNFYCIDFSPEQGLWAATAESVSSTNIMTSTNSVTWTQRSKPDTTAISGIVWCSAFGRWIANGSSNIYTSTDGTTWTLSYTMSTGLASFCYEPSYAVVNGVPIYALPVMRSSGTGTMSILTSTDGTTFTNTQISSETIWQASDGKAIVWSSEIGRYIITNQGSVNRTLTSTSATQGWTSYTQSTSPANAIPFGPAAGNKLFVRTSFSGGNTTTPINYSSLGTNGTWTASTLPNAAYGFYDTEWAPEIGLFFIVRSNAANGFSSTNGITWTQRTVSGTEFTHVSWGPGVRTNGYKQGAGIT